ncbi:MAG TPA: glutathione S-transferase family protein [Verrucomicrobiota bacterium]|nr:glutathione S-transferase family protein [Verrucomicrobiales bacterium]HRI15450.1 glutathione S-transferase family protein [Verrucomicrobiota bacterium]
MPAPNLYQLPHSPFCLPIAQALTAWQVPFSVTNVSNGNRREIVELTNGSSYEVPVLVHGDRIVFEHSADSQNVARYVDSMFAHGALFPARWEGIQSVLLPYLERDVEGLTFRLTDIHYIPAIADLTERTLVIRHKERRFGRGCVDQWRQQRESLAEQAATAMHPFELMLQETPYLLDQQPVYADFLLHGILQNLTWNHWNPLPPLARMTEWFQRLSAYRHG